MFTDFINLFRRKRVEQELDEELRFHFERQVQKYLDGGMSRDDALRRARLQFGGMDQVKEECREARGTRYLESLLQDIRCGWRMLRKYPGFTAITIVTFALGIGVNTAIFTLTYAVILKGLPVPNPGQLVRYTFRNGAQDIGLSGPVYDAMRKFETVSTDLLAWSSAGFQVERNGKPEKATSGALISGNGFRVLQLQPVLGRAFDEADDVPGGGPNGYQALLGYNYWKQSFHQSPAVLGQTLAIDGRSVTVIGVLPEGFDGLVVGQPTDLLLPLSFEEAINRPGSKSANSSKPIRHDAGAFWLTVMGRLKPGETLQTAAANLKATEAAIRAEGDPKHLFLGGFFAPFQFGVESGRSGRSYLRVAFSQPLIVLEILAGLLLLLCCANLALLMLARVSSRVREFALRAALGAQSGRLFQQVLCEVGMLAGCGLCAGVGLGWAAARLLVGMSASLSGPPPGIDAAPSAVILSFTAAVTLLSAIGAGLWPAVRASRPAPVEGLKSDTRASTRQAGRWMVPAQVAVSVTLLIAASLLGSAFLRLLLEDSGFHAGNVTLGEIELNEVKASPQATQEAKLMLEAAQRMPGVESAALVSSAPLRDEWAAGHYFSIGENGAVHTDLQTWRENASPRFFATLGIRLLEGRDFVASDDNGEPVCILSNSAAKYLFPGERALGKFVYGGVSNPALDGKAKVDPENVLRVIGVVEDTRYRSLRETPPRMLFRPIRNAGLGFRFWLMLRSHDPALSAGAIRQAVRRTGDAQPFAIFTFHELVATHLRKERMLMFLSVAFAGIALLLTCVGLYGLLARSVVVRTKEIGVRLALGASPRDALTLVVRQGMSLVIAGAAAGLLAAFALTRLLRNLLYGVEGIGVAALATTITLLVIVALLACYVPARRAMRVDPIVALRHE